MKLSAKLWTRNCLQNSLKLEKFRCWCCLLSLSPGTLFSVQTSGTSNVHIEILNIFIQLALTHKSVLQISYIKPPRSALLLVVPLSCFPCQWDIQSFSASPLQLIPTDLPVPTQSQTSRAKPPWDPLCMDNIGLPNSTSLKIFKK